MKIAWLAMLAAGVLGQEPSHPIRVGSKTFTESVILGEIAAQLLKDADVPTLHRRELGGRPARGGRRAAASA